LILITYYFSLWQLSLKSGKIKGYEYKDQILRNIFFH
jgi:hypothetical protein